MTLYLSRLTLNRAAGMAAVSSLLDPDAAGPATDAHHRLIWTLFGDRVDRTRDFLWRADGKGRFLVLSARPPQGNDLFAPPEVKEFAPSLAPGDRLGFSLRANATKTRKTGATTRSGAEHKAHDDIIMRRLHPLTTGRAEERARLVEQEAQSWMALQGTASGFTPEEVAVEDYSTVELPGKRGGRGKPPRFGVLDLTGVLRVDDPAAFTPALARGFGRAKGYGCGLMLIRRI